jgi:hypothetical protein
MSYIRGVGYSQFLVEPDGRTFTMGGLEVNPETLELLEKEPVIVIKPEDEAINVIPEQENKCSICDRIFDTSFGLSVHERSHKKEV